MRFPKLVFCGCAFAATLSLPTAFAAPSPPPSPLDLTVTNATNPIVYFDISIDGKDAGRMTFELYADTVPYTAHNFRALCTGECRRHWSQIWPFGRHGKRLHYKGSTFHRMSPWGCHGGDFEWGDGSGGRSVYGPVHYGYFSPGSKTHKFPNEHFRGKAGKHTGFGCLSMEDPMSNDGPNVNGSQFVICTMPTPWKDGQNVVFGKLVSGEDVLRAMQKDNVTLEGRQPPKHTVVIVDCGQIS